MSKTSSRAQRVGDLLQRELAVLIQREIKDPRLGMVSVTGVDVSRDLGYADVYITVLDNRERASDGGDLSDEQTAAHREQLEDNLQILDRAAGFLRSLLARRLTLRSIPRLRFHYDESISRGQYLSALIDDALAADRDQHH